MRRWQREMVAVCWGTRPLSLVPIPRPEKAGFGYNAPHFTCPHCPFWGLLAHLPSPYLLPAQKEGGS